MVGTDSDGLNLYLSEIGTNMNENLHQKYADLIGPFAVGTKIAHVLTASRSFRYNISVGIDICGEPDFGTDQHEVVDITQKWFMKLFGIFAWPAHKNLLDFDGINFISVGIGPLPHDEELVTKGESKEHLSSDYKFMCQNMGVNLAPLPISTVEEHKRFKKFMNNISSKNVVPTFNDYKRLGIDFLNVSNGKNIFPKTINMLQKHYKKWQMNRQIKLFSIKVKKNYENLHKKLSAQRVPPPKTRIFSIKDTVPPKVTSIDPIPKIKRDIIKKEELADRTKKSQQICYIHMAKPCVRWPYC